MGTSLEHHLCSVAPLPLPMSIIDSGSMSSQRLILGGAAEAASVPKTVSERVAGKFFYNLL